MNFRQFFETREREMADTWRSSTHEARMFRKDSITSFVEHAATKSNQTTASFLLNGQFKEIHEIHPISAFLEAPKEILKDLYFEISRLKTAFLFCDDGIGCENVGIGDILLRLEPFTFNNYDKIIFQGVVKHELTHALDWARNPVAFAREAVRKDEIVFNRSIYNNNLNEARACSVMLNHYLTEVQGKEQVLHMISQSRGKFGGRPNDAYFEIMKVYIEDFYKQHPVKQERTAISVNIDQIFNKVKEMVDLLRFSLFFKFPYQNA